MLAVNQVLQNRYRIIRQLGEGGMGAVYEAEDNQRFSKSVALKEILLNLTQKNPEHFRRAFEREAKILTQIDHEAVPRIFAYFHETESQFLVMELIEGDDLDKILDRRQKAFPLENVVQWTNQLLDALDYLHTLKQPIIHRDIKPQNLKLTRRGKIKLLDFGIAKDTVADFGSTTKSFSSHKTFVGATIYYSPIEQIIRIPEYFDLLDSINTEKAQKLMSQPADARSDIYALGATLYSLLTNDFPKPAHVRMLEVLTGKPDSLKPLHKLNSEVSPEISAVIEQSMAIERGDRFASAREMQEALLDATSLEKRRKEAEDRYNLMAEQDQVRREREELEAERRQLAEDRQAQVKRTAEAERQRQEEIEYKKRLAQWQNDNLQAETLKKEENLPHIRPLANTLPLPENPAQANTFDWTEAAETEPVMEASAPSYLQNIEIGLPKHSLETLENTPRTAPVIPVTTETGSNKKLWIISAAVAGLFIFGFAILGAFLLLRTTGDSGGLSNKTNSQQSAALPTATPSETPSVTPTPGQGTAVTSTPAPIVTQQTQQTQPTKPKPTLAPTASKPQTQQTTVQPTKPPNTPDKSDDCVYNGKCRNR